MGSFVKLCLAFPDLARRGRLRAEDGQATAFRPIGEEAGFDAVNAAESPLGPGQLARAGLLAVVDGVLLGEDGVAGAEAVGAGAAAIGVDLFSGWRKSPFDSRKTRAG